MENVKAKAETKIENIVTDYVRDNTTEQDISAGTSIKRQLPSK